jgi:hypothetical protein
MRNSTISPGATGVSNTSAAAAGPTPDGRWWTCPPWCRGDCTGGETEQLGDGRTAVTGRLHERVLADVTYADQRQMRIQVVAERCDNPDGAPSVEQVVLHVEREPLPVELGPSQVAGLTTGLSDEACRRQLAMFLAGAYDSVAIDLSPSLRRTLAAALLELDGAGRRARPR